VAKLITKRPVPRVGAALLALFLLGAAETPAAECIYRLLDARLELMDEVAAFKWHRKLPIENREREAVVLKQAAADSLRLGFTPDSSHRFFAAQIEAAKAIQRHWFRIWKTGGSPAVPPDLDAEVRPELLRLGSAILAAAGDASSGSRRAFEQTVQVEGLDRQSRTAIFDALENLERFRNRLEQIVSTGVLRIGTTGDYAPFTYRTGQDESPVGIDIDLGLRLADALGVEAAFVETSWPTLLDDLVAGRYDIAMGGVSRTLERQKQGYLSPAYYAGGKTPIARCNQADRYGSLEAIDRPGVRVIVNPGGTNEAFLDTNVHRAVKVPHEDNRTIFDALVAGRADVMITDRIEAELQAKRHPELCATMPGTITYQQKGYLMPQDGPWHAFVATWLELAIADGTVSAVFREHGVEPHIPGGAGRTPPRD
jgi:cyclohexadienyl dehydratase